MAGPTRSDELFDRLRSEILAGTLAPGDPLPSERQLAEEHAVNRHAVREAVKRLLQAGLVRVSHGGATRVLDWRVHGGLDLLADLPLGEAADTVALVRSVLEMRLCIGVDAARRCAERAPLALVAELPMLASSVRVARAAPEREQAYRALWSRIVDGADNLAYRLALNGLLAGIDRHHERFLALLDAEIRDDAGVQDLVGAISAHDGDGAGAAATRLLSRAVHAALQETGGR